MADVKMVTPKVPSAPRKRRGGRLAQYRQKAELLRLHLSRRGSIAAGELDAYWPGGAENPDRGMGGWVRCLCNYSRFLERSSSPAAAAAPMAEAERAAMAAIERQPVTVTLTGAPAGPGRRAVTVDVHPKGLVALERIRDRERVIAFLCAEIAALGARPATPDVLGVLGRAGAELTHQYRLIAWAITTPGARLPWPEREPAPVLPSGPAWTWLHSLESLDYYLLADACQTLHARRLVLMEGLLAPDDSPAGTLRRPSFAEFAVAYSEQRHIDPDALLLDHDLPGLFAAAKLSASAQRRAHQEASAAADAKARAGKGA